MKMNLYWVFEEVGERHFSFIAEVEACLFWNAYFDAVDNDKTLTHVDATNQPYSVTYTDRDGRSFVVINMSGE